MNNTDPTPNPHPPWNLPLAYFPFLPGRFWKERLSVLMQQGGLVSKHTLPPSVPCEGGRAAAGKGGQGTLVPFSQG